MCADMHFGEPHPPRSLQNHGELPRCLLCSSRAARCFASGCDMALSSRVGTPGGHGGMLKKRKDESRCLDAYHRVSHVKMKNLSIARLLKILNAHFYTGVVSE